MSIGLGIGLRAITLVTLGNARVGVVGLLVARAGHVHALGSAAGVLLVTWDSQYMAMLQRRPRHVQASKHVSWGVGLWVVAGASLVLEDESWAAARASSEVRATRVNFILTSQKRQTWWF